ncbi:MAG: hypothetical protein E5Y06_26735 [Mesorhizobium sp.]|nr:MAG: hypothetical protein E5Y06_26735 [Mesorhizobium sp.]TJU94644.1 MAG: hypothetical protein E5Y08_29280 [Mesorhizobium sp.]
MRRPCLLESGAPLHACEIIGCGEGTDADRYALLDKIAVTPAQPLAGVIAKLAVVVREASDNTDLCEFPLPHIRSALADLRRLTQEGINSEPAGWPAGDQSIGALFEQSASSFAAWRAFSAWSQGDEEAYCAWTDTFKTLEGASQ